LRRLRRLRPQYYYSRARLLGYYVVRSMAHPRPPTSYYVVASKPYFLLRSSQGGMHTSSASRGNLLATVGGGRGHIFLLRSSRGIYCWLACIRTKSVLRSPASSST